jgi:hypothetical protein
VIEAWLINTGRPSITLEYAVEGRETWFTGPTLQEVVDAGARARAELDLVDGGTLDLAAIADPGEANGRQAVDGKLAWVFANGGGGFRNGGFRNGGFLNGGGFRNGGFYNGGFRNGGFLNGGGFRNGGGWRNYW